MWIILWRNHLSMPIAIPGQSSPLSNIIEQDTLLNQSFLRLFVRSRQFNCNESMLESLRISLNRLLLMMKGTYRIGYYYCCYQFFQDCSCESWKDFAAEEESKEKLDRPGSPWASNKDLYKPPKNHKAKSQFCTTSSASSSIADHGSREILPSIIGN